MPVAALKSLDSLRKQNHDGLLCCEAVAPGPQTLMMSGLSRSPHCNVVSLSARSPVRISARRRPSARWTNTISVRQDEKCGGRLHAHPRWCYRHIVGLVGTGCGLAGIGMCISASILRLDGRAMLTPSDETWETPCVAARSGSPLPRICRSRRWGAGLNQRPGSLPTEGHKIIPYLATSGV